jgi:beta-lactamase class A
MNKFKKILILFVLFFVLVKVAYSLNTHMAENNTVNTILSPLADPQAFLDGLSNPGLLSVVKKSMEGTKGTYGIAIKNLKTGEEYYQNQHLSFPSASLYKLWVMAVAYDQLEKGKLKPDDVLSSSIVDLNKQFNIASESAELKEGEIRLTANQALFQMITISHNYAALLLSKKVGLTNVTNFLKANSFFESNIGQPPKTTAKDIEKFFEKLYNGEIVSKKQSVTMLGLLRQQKINDRIPQELPEDIDVAHKTGEIDYFKHDAGIVFGKKADYVIVVLSKSDNPQAAAIRIAGLSKAVYDYFEN